MPCFFVCQGGDRSAGPISAEPRAPAARCSSTARACASAGNVCRRDRASGSRSPCPSSFFRRAPAPTAAQCSAFTPGSLNPAISAGCARHRRGHSLCLRGRFAERELCWYGDDAFLPHLWKALGTRGFSAEVRFGEPRVYAHRRIAAAETSPRSPRCAARRIPRQPTFDSPPRAAWWYRHIHPAQTATGRTSSRQSTGSRLYSGSLNRLHFCISCRGVARLSII